ncbi:MAG: acyltransferase [Flaviflexus sp.]|uniref:acyltransferase family protein n=1 Tax=Flaviflexus sp. TaxID=1969482 RepID=UPI00352C7D7C
MDVVRGIAIIAVIYGHAEAIGRQESLFESPDWMITSNRVLVLLRMPMLMFLSGMLVPRSIRRGWKSFLPGKFTKLAWPYAVWMALFFVVLWIHDVATLDQIPMEILQPDNPNLTPLWYLRNLFFYYIFAQILVWLRLPLWVGIFVGLGLGAYQVAFVPDPDQIDLRWGFLMVFFFLGALIMDHLKAFINFLRKPPVTLVLIVLALIPIYLYVERITAVRYRPEYIWGPIAFTLLVVAYASYIKSSWITKPIEFIGRNSLYYYVMHYPMFLGYSWWFGWRTDWGIGHFYALMALGLIVPTIAVYVCRWIPPLKWLFFELPWPRRKPAPKKQPTVDAATTPAVAPASESALVSSDSSSLAEEKPDFQENKERRQDGSRARHSADRSG